MTKSQWIIEEKTGEGTIGISKYSSLTRALHSFTRRLTGVKIFYLVVPGETPSGKIFIKVMIVHKEVKENDTGR